MVTAVTIPYVNDHMGLSIFSCLCCCWIIGIFAIIKSSEVNLVLLTIVRITIEGERLSVMSLPYLPLPLE